MYLLRTRASGAGLIVALALGVVMAPPTAPTRCAPTPLVGANEKEEPFEYEIGGVTKKATRRVRTLALGAGTR